MKKKYLLISFLVFIANVWGGTMSKGAEISNDKLLKVSGQVIPNRYIVVTKPTAQINDAKLKVTSSAINMANNYGAKVHYQYTTALHGFAATLSASALQALLQLDEVLYIEPDTVISTKPITDSNTLNSKSTKGKQGTNQNTPTQEQSVISKAIAFKLENEAFRLPDE